MVVSIVITLAGTIALFSLPIAQYPQITPPSVSVSISYPGASAEVVAETVAAPIEQSVNGVQGMLYMSSNSGSDGSYSLSVTFEVGTDLNTALVMVQNRVTLALPLLPSSVQNQGITIRKKTPDQLMIISLYTTEKNYTNIDLSNFALINLKDELLRVDGVSDVTIMGEKDFSIRVWLDPQKLAARNLTAIDVANAIRSQSTPVAAGQVGQPPAPKNQIYQLPIDMLSRLNTPEQFGDDRHQGRQSQLPANVGGNENGAGGRLPAHPGSLRVPLGKRHPPWARRAAALTARAAHRAAASIGRQFVGGGGSTPRRRDQPAAAHRPAAGRRPAASPLRASRPASTNGLTAAAVTQTEDDWKPDDQRRADQQRADEQRGVGTIARDRSPQGRDRRPSEPAM